MSRILFAHSTSRLTGVSRRRSLIHLQFRIRLIANRSLIAVEVSVATFNQSQNRLPILENYAKDILCRKKGKREGENLYYEIMRKRKILRITRAFFIFRLIPPAQAHPQKEEEEEKLLHCNGRGWCGALNICMM